MASSEIDNTQISSEDKNVDITGNGKCLLDHLEISVTEAEKRANSALNIRDYYTVYLIETKKLNDDWHLPTRPLGLLWRRYTEFEQLRSYLEVTFLWAVVPPLPEKRPLYTWHNTPTDTFDPDFVDRRRASLENFLHRIAAHPILSKDPIFLGFLQQEDGWKETVKQTGYLQKAETKLRALSMGVRLRCTDSRFEDIKTYATGLHGNLHNLLRVRAKLAARLYSIHKLHQGYGRVFSEWSVAEKDMGDGLQKAGHFFDSIAAGIGAALEDEELVADQLKEYLFFSGALQALCRRQELMQYELEQAQENVRMKNQDKIRVQQGRSGLMSRLFGSVEPEEVREMKVTQLEARIQAGEQVVQDSKLALSDFSKKAVQEFEGFQQKKSSDLKETLATYMSLQINMAKKAAGVKKQYCVDELAQHHGHQVIRLPPYYCIFNPIELVWAALKRNVRRGNKTPSMSDGVIKIVREEINKIGEELWRKCCQHVETEEGRTILTPAIEPFIISVEEEDDDEEEEENIEYENMDLQA